MNNVEFTAICFFSLRMNHKAVQNFYKASQFITMHASVHLINKTDSLTSVTMSAIRFRFVKAKSNVIITAYQKKKEYTIESWWKLNVKTSNHLKRGKM